jgi:hypothetical protein
MKASLLVSAVLAGIAGIGAHADAQNYPWCARYAKGGDGQNCGFVTLSQCMANVSGIGGYCARNTQYVRSVAMPNPRAMPGPRTRVRRRSRRHPLAR